MKKFNKKDLKPCELKPIEKELSQPLPGVPIHFNYGIFFDDDYDYMQHLKSASDTREGYAISVIPEDCKSTTCSQSDSSEVREPEVDYDEHVFSDLNMESEAESFDDESEIEDNFVELAGGHTVKTSETDDEDPKAAMTRHFVNEKPAETDISRLSKDKVSLMERFLYGTNESSTDISCSDVVDNSSKGDYPDDATILNREFEKLILRYKSRSSCGQSFVSGTSVMSEGLKYALSRDIAIAKQGARQDDEELDDELKSITIKKCYDLNEEELQDDDESDCTYSVRNIKVTGFNDEPKPNAVKYNHLPMPNTNKNKKKSVLKDNSEDNASVLELSKPLDPELLVRKKGESTEDKRLRRGAIKQHRQLRRKIRKANQLNFRQEKERQIRNNMQAMVVH
ncbi:unnamed protein product [Heterobilharzia americana]|nr:unnamed protein product [Heterobilharzia americana]CAH8470764.1 unnamed protein product [Heterobilharzia americana]